MELSAGQVTQLGEALPSSSVRSLHLLHLSCAWNGLQALTSLINNPGGSVTGLDLSGCWAATSSTSQSIQVTNEEITKRSWQIFICLFLHHFLLGGS
jgi:hypothetical protein